MIRVAGAREQMNGATSFLDGSTIYGNTQETAHSLRTFDGGFLKTSAGDLLPFQPDDCDNSNERYVAIPFRSVPFRSVPATWNVQCPNLLFRQLQKEHVTP